jgi:hypothetical protein
MRWFGNIIRNLAQAQKQNRSVPPVREAAIFAAGPSLDMQVPQLLKSSPARRPFLISVDTALPALLHHGLKPDAIVSIDCQHISYLHFMGKACRDIPLFLDIASPPMLSNFSSFPFFFSGGHPLAAYISQEWRPLPLLDTSGGNVTYACLSLAESLGAQRITVYGADFSYPMGKMYAKGTYLYPFFDRLQERRAPLESRFSSFFYRSPFLPPNTPNCYETEAMHFYRKRFEEKAAAMEAEIYAAPGYGMPLVLNKTPGRNYSAGRTMFAPGKANMGAGEFLERYRQDIAALPAALPVALSAGGAIPGYSEAQRRVFTTLLPLAAALRRRRPEMKALELIAEVKQHCTNAIESLLRSEIWNNNS